MSMEMSTGSAQAKICREFYETAKVVPVAADSELFTIEIPPGAEFLYFEVANNGGNAFDEFKVLRRVLQTGSWETIASVANDYLDTADMKWPLLTCSGAPVTLADGSSVHILMNVKAVSSVKITVSAGTASTADYFGKVG